MKNAIVLCSGGPDSIVATFLAKNSKRYDKIKLLFFNYGQRNYLAEKHSVKYFAKLLEIEMIEIKLNLMSKNTLLTNKKGRVDKISLNDLKDTKKESDRWYVPSRNLIFLSVACSIAETFGETEIITGFINNGRESFPDTSKKFVKDFNETIKFSGVRVIAPLIEKDKNEVFSIGKKIGIELDKTYSCYASNKHCGVCLACRLRQEAFYWAGIKDETKYSLKAKDFRTN